MGKQKFIFFFFVEERSGPFVKFSVFCFLIFFFDFFFCFFFLLFFLGGGEGLNEFTITNQDKKEVFHNK